MSVLNCHLAQTYIYFIKCLSPYVIVNDALSLATYQSKGHLGTLNIK